MVFGCASGVGVLGMVLKARMGARNSVVKSCFVASWRIVDSFSGREAERAVLEGASQRRETPFLRRAEATAGRMVDRAAASTRSVSTALHAAG